MMVIKQDGELFRQCSLTTSHPLGTLSTVAWIQLKYGFVGNRVLLPKSSVPNQEWTIEAAYSMRMEGGKLT